MFSFLTQARKEGGSMFPGYLGGWQPPALTGNSVWEVAHAPLTHVSLPTFQYPCPAGMTAERHAIGIVPLWSLSLWVLLSEVWEFILGF